MVAALLVIASMGVLTYKGATAREALASENLAQVPEWQAQQQLPEDAIPGARIFAQLTCLNCHSYLGTGGGFPGAPDLPAKKVAYETLVTDYMNRPTFGRQMFFFWRDTLGVGAA